MDIHLLTPFYRKDLAATQIHYLKPHRIKWYPLMAPSDKIHFEEDWIFPIMVNELKPGDACFKKVDDFINTQKIIDGDYYGVMCDETNYEPGFFDILRQQTAKIVICSSYRGDTIPRDGSCPHPTRPLIVRTISDIRMNRTGMGQYFVKGEIFKYLLYTNKGRQHDGHYVDELRKRFSNDIKLLESWFVFANYLQAGRFTKREKFIKPNWELPKFI